MGFTKRLSATPKRRTASPKDYRLGQKTNGFSKRLPASPKDYGLLQKTIDEHTEQVEELNTAERERLRELARVAAAHAYAPYSGFRVGAALLLEDGTVVAGCNVENCSYRLTSCAEQGAIARAVAEFGPKIRVRAVAVANLNEAASMPCGACRQTLSEFGEDAMVVLYPGEDGAMEETTLGELLPHAFRMEYLS